jgi:hypothetical protein
MCVHVNAGRKPNKMFLRTFICTSHAQKNLSFETLLHITVFAEYYEISFTQYASHALEEFLKDILIK